ncbi:hypothetical protein [Rhodocista pekingensis]|uniref:Uncharacterized protein n=1 Tax=Rhodocista pekingensis TaxID=201185 RepID=A0ABW2KRX0_9PROT
MIQRAAVRDSFDAEDLLIEAFRLTEVYSLATDEERAELEAFLLDLAEQSQPVLLRA